MFFNCILISSLACITNAFHTPASEIRSQFKVRMSVEDDLYGAIPPIGFFDPLGLSIGKSPIVLKKYREAELKHGRVAMLACLGLLVAESYKPLFGSLITGPGIYHFQQAGEILPNFWLLVLFAVALIEGQIILTGWEKPGESKGIVAELREDYTPGDIGFDPLGFKPSDPEDFDIMRTKELNNGRLAMIGIAGMVVQELINHKSILENYYSLFPGRV